MNFILFGNKASLFKKIDLLDTTKRWLVTIKEFTELRTDLQNRLSHAWYYELEKELKENTATGYKCFCKLHFGVPILRTEDDDFRSVYDKAIKSLSYEQKIEIMKILPVTSLMNTKQLSEYLEAMKAHYLQNNGYELKFPNDY
jgi:hypothetical protein